MSSELPTSRMARTSKLGRFAAGQAARQVGTRAGTFGRSEETRARVLEQRSLETADQIVSVLGSMKGAAMKLGQMMSVIDLGIVPESVRPEFQRKLAVLFSQAPVVSFEQMRTVLENDLGTRVDMVFSEFDEHPVAAASIGQVYRARLMDGREVAVKVQYPGITTAVRADLKNLALFLRFSKRFRPGLDMVQLGEEIRARIEEELDYRREAKTQHQIAVKTQGHPFIVVPDSVLEFCGEHVLVTEFVDGIAFDGIVESSQDVRNRVAEAAYRFYCGSIFRDHEFPGDPHPGNLILRHDGKVAFLDFGLFKRMEPASVDTERECLRAASEGRAEDLHRVLNGLGVFSDPDRISPDEMHAYVLDAVGWYLVDEEIHVTPEMATDALIASVDPRSPHFRKLRWQHLPAEHVFTRRAELYTFGLIGQLHATANWHRIGREWLYGDEPVTDLGRQEALWRNEKV